MKQRTLQSSFTLQGIGLHTGQNIVVTFNPAPVDHGYKIRRVDLEDQPVIEALAEHVVHTQRGTVLGKGNVMVSTIEHGFAALYALGIDNCLIDVNASEFPILDGSAIEYVREIRKAGVAEQEKDKDFYIVRNKMEVTDPETGSKLTLLPDDAFCINSFIEFDSQYIPNQSASMDTVTDFEKEIASCRTFVFVREIEQLRRAGLIKGGNLDNAIVIYEKKLSQKELDEIADELGVPHHNADELGYLNHRKLL
ncbi:MAG: Bifunctional enzyme lpxC/fabZ, partial [Proteiniphilum sp. 51_7]